MTSTRRDAPAARARRAALIRRRVVAATLATFALAWGGHRRLADRRADGPRPHRRAAYNARGALARHDRRAGRARARPARRQLHEPEPGRPDDPVRPRLRARLDDDRDRRRLAADRARAVLLRARPDRARTVAPPAPVHGARLDARRRARSVRGERRRRRVVPRHRRAGRDPRVGAADLRRASSRCSTPTGATRSRSATRWRRSRPLSSPRASAPAASSTERWRPRSWPPATGRRPRSPFPLPLTLSGPGAADGWLRYGGVVVLDDGTHRVVEAR
jgi:hypothetical protein